ncbi:hypothetical protein C0J52_16514 [Blattella germanica]|nr:hypothetical protein C0J52_16514 [Blattella germanica]
MQWPVEANCGVFLPSFCTHSPEAEEGGLPFELGSSASYAQLLSLRPIKQYSPEALDQAVEDIRTGKFNSIRACARHHGVPMTTLHYRLKSFASTHGREERRKHLQLGQDAWHSTKDPSELDGEVEHQKLVPDAETASSVPGQSEGSKKNETDGNDAVKVVRDYDPILINSMKVKTVLEQFVV